MSGARVVVLEQEWASAISDEHGAYSIGGVRPSYQTISPLLSASKAGFFTATEFASGDYRPITADTRLDLLMMPLVTVPVGETLHGRVIAGAEHPCSNYGYGTTDCQRFAMTMPATGFLEITLSGPTFKHDVDVVGPDGTFVLYDASWSTPQRYTIGVHAGSTYEIRVAIFTGVDFDLSTTLRVESTSPLRAR